MSNYCTNRDSNRGGCAQICRWTFDYYKNNDKVTDIPFSMTPKDLNMVSYVKEMIEAGVNSFKIEGRMRSIYYVSTVILIYRRIIDKLLNNTLTDKYMTYALNILNIGFVILIISWIVDIIAAIRSIRFSNFICDKYFGLATSIMATFIRKYADYNNIIDYDEFDDILDELSEYCIRLTQ